MSINATTHSAHTKAALRRGPGYRTTISVFVILLGAVVSALCFTFWRDRWWTNAIGGVEAITTIQGIVKALWQAEGGMDITVGKSTLHLGGRSWRVVGYRVDDRIDSIAKMTVELYDDKPYQVSRGKQR